jgi:hypothetical protein
LQSGARVAIPALAPDITTALVPQAIAWVENSKSTITRTTDATVFSIIAAIIASIATSPLVSYYV